MVYVGSRHGDGDTHEKRIRGENLIGENPIIGENLIGEKEVRTNHKLVELTKPTYGFSKLLNHAGNRSTKNDMGEAGRKK